MTNKKLALKCFKFDMLKHDLEHLDATHVWVPASPKALDIHYYTPDTITFSRGVNSRETITVRITESIREINCIALLVEKTIKKGGNQ